MPPTVTKKGKPKNKKKRQLVLKPIGLDDSINSQASTVPYYPHETSLREDPDTTVVGSPGDTDSDESTYEGEDNALRNDMPIVQGRWKKHETNALMDALNVNRMAVKYHFTGPGGGKEVRREAWKAVARYVNDVADTHRTVKQCSSKASDYCQRQKGKYNRLRRAVDKTGAGRIPEKMKLTRTQEKALDYLREEAVRGILGIEPMDIGGPLKPKPSEANKALLWRPGARSYSKVKMEPTAVPKKKDRVAEKRKREEKKKRKEEHARKMREEREREKSLEKKRRRAMREGEVVRAGVINYETEDEGAEEEYENYLSEQEEVVEDENLGVGENVDTEDDYEEEDDAEDDYEEEDDEQEEGEEDSEEDEALQQLLKEKAERKAYRARVRAARRQRREARDDN